jgi:excinuclease ABC subunit C
VSEQEYANLVKDFCNFLDGDTDEVVQRLQDDMSLASKNLEYEKAARLRDRLQSVAKAIEKQQIVGERNEDIDLIGIAQDELEAAVQVFYVRKGRVVGRKGFVLDKVEDLSQAGLVDRIIEALYGDEPLLGIPKMLLVPELPESMATYEEWLSFQRGTKVEIRIPQRGDKRELHELVTRNATEEFHRHRMKRSSDHNSRSRALTELQDLLGLIEAPLRIECYDMAHLQGTDYVGSMVVLEDGLPNKREYRRFKVKDVPGNDDYAAMEEVLTRRFKAYLVERDQVSDTEALATGERKRFKRFAYPPQLLLVDGGKGQLGVAERVLKNLGLETEIPVASLAKRFEEVFIPGQSHAVEIPRGSEALFMLQRIRDEAHRFANSFHRELRDKRMVSSALDGIEGLGEARKKKITQAFGGVNAVKQASLEDLRSQSWLPEAVAQAIFDKFH